MVDGERQAGWWADPAGRHEYRYWDGTQWTDQVSDAGQISQDAPQAERRKRSPMMVLLVLATVFVWVVAALGIVLAVALGNDNDDRFAEEQTALEARKVDAKSAQTDVEAKTAAVAAAMNAFKTATTDTVAKHDDYVAKLDAAIPSVGDPSDAEIQTVVRPAADAFAAAVIAQQNAFAQLGTAVAQLEEVLR